LAFVGCIAIWTGVFTQSADARFELLLNVSRKFSELLGCFAGED